MLRRRPPPDRLYMPHAATCTGQRTAEPDPIRRIPGVTSLTEWRRNRAARKGR